MDKRKRTRMIQIRTRTIGNHSNWKCDSEIPMVRTSESISPSIVATPNFKESFETSSSSRPRIVGDLAWKIQALSL